MRSVIYIRVPAFLVAIERKRRPELVGRAVIVGRPKGNTSGVVVDFSPASGPPSLGRDSSLQVSYLEGHPPPGKIPGGIESYLEGHPPPGKIPGGIESYLEGHPPPGKIPGGIESYLEGHPPPGKIPGGIDMEGMSVRQAQRACPDAVVVMADYPTYAQVSEQFLNILAQYSPLLEPDSLGSAYLDVTGSRALFGEAPLIAARIASEVREKLDMAVAIGNAKNKLVAKIVALVGLPVGEGFQIPPQREFDFLTPLPIGMLDSITPKIEKRLHELGVSTIGQLAAIPERLLMRQFGPIGSLMRKQSLGEDASQVLPAYPPDVIITEQTFEHSIDEPAELEEYLYKLADDSLAKLRKRGSLAGGISLRLEELGVGSWGLGSAFPNSQPLAPNSFFCFKKPTDSPRSIHYALGKMLMEKMRPGMEVSGVRIVLSELTVGVGSQLCLIGEGERRLKIDRTIEHIRDRFGDKSIFRASALKSEVLERIAA